MVSSNLILITGFLFLGGSILYTGYELRKKRLVYNAQFRLEQIKFINDPDINKALTEILWVWEWVDFDDYWSKYSPRANPELNVIRRSARNYYVALAYIVRNGDLDIELLYELNPSGVTRYWDKIEPIALEFRKRNNYPDYIKSVEYLNEKIKVLRERKGMSAPSQISK
jgi:hypothetical protein